MFTGSSVHNIDSKGRIVLPSKFREELGQEIIVTAGFDNNIQIMSKEEFKHLIEQIKLLPADKALSLQYVLVSPACEVNINSQGRIPIPQKLRDDLSLENEVVIIGMDNRIELWNKDEFDKFIRKQKQDTYKEALELLRL